jgi:peptidoglycan/xylan/chitin deacetylase (PgdA/CDA1 family)
MEHPSRRRHDVDGPERILDALGHASVRATFFVQGRWARSEPRLAARVCADGHLLGCHSHFHAPLPSLHDDGIRRDVEAATLALQDVCGVDPRPWFRCPFGAGHDDPRVLAALAELGYRNVHWDVEPADWLEEISAENVHDRVVAGVAAGGDESIVLLHSWPTVTADALQGILQTLADSGCTFVGVDDLRLEPEGLHAAGRV